MPGGIFMIGDGDKLIQFTDELYPSEDVLQTYVEHYPDLLAGDLIDAESPRRWVLVQRESPLAREAGGGAWWSIDHVFLDQDGIPTLVEVKRSSDTRIRREVIGQMMEYAAHAVVYWPVEKMRAQFESTCRANDAEADPVRQVAELLDLPADAAIPEEVEGYWARVGENLEQGHLRLLFVADSFPPETKRIIEFLNEKMNDVEVLAVEIKQFTGDGRPILVPRLYGQSEVAQDRKGRARGNRVWDETRYFERLQAEHPELVETVRRVYQWAQTEGLTTTWGTGVETGSLSLRTGSGDPRLLSLLTDGRIEFAIPNLKEPFAQVEARRELAARFAAIPGFSLPSDAHARYPSASLAVLIDEDVLQQFLSVVTWWAHETRAASGENTGG